jgi:signal transduction histidine kinase
MDVAHPTPEPMTTPQRRFSRVTDNPLARAVGRVPVPLGAKLVASFAAIAALLAIGYLLGFLALRKSNGRGEQLRTLQRQTAFEQLLLSDAAQLQGTTGQLVYSPNSPALRAVVGANVAQFCADSAVRCGLAFGYDSTGVPTSSGHSLVRLAPAVAHDVEGQLKTFGHLTFVGGTGTTPTAPTSPATVQAARNATTAMMQELQALLNRTRARATALVAQNHQSYVSSRNLLIGVGAGTLVLVLGLGLLLASSIVIPLRRTRARLAGIAAGDFSTAVEVSNRDELGGLAADVNRMNDELKRLYGELETASRHKSDFLATMSHELRTPLNAIIGFSEVLREQMFGELNERQLAYVNDVLEAGKHLLSLINDVLDLAKIEAGRMELDLSEFALPDVLRSAVSLHSEQANRGGIRLGLTTNPEEITVNADERRVRQVVFNLVSNAVKFTPRDGRIDVSAGLGDGHVEVAVADTGPGLSPDELESIFEEFEQTDAGKQVEGTGLGLPLSRRLVELHGGRLWAESTPGQGSTFRFTLPFAPERAA